MAQVRAIFFDVAHTLLGKPGVLPAMREALSRHGIHVPLAELRARHSLIMDSTVFPDRTDNVFYRNFNAAVVRSLGALPTMSLLDDIFAACSYQPWVAFDDTSAIGGLPLDCGVLSNWDNTLKDKLAGAIGIEWRWILGSAEQGARKPDPAFFALLPECTGLGCNEIAYVGDSMRLDIEPATRLGFRTVLIDRDGLFPHSSLPRITSLEQLESVL